MDDYARSIGKCGIRCNFPDLDIIKLVMAILVVQIHTHPFFRMPLLWELIDAFARVAVPFFFIASGFLCFLGLSDSSFSTPSASGSIRVRNTVRKLLNLYVVWTVIFMPVTVFGCLLSGNGLLHSIAVVIRGIFLVGENYYSWHLWYLLASVVGFSLVYFCLRIRMGQARMLLISFILLLIGYGITYAQGLENAPSFLSTPVKVYSAIFVTSRNGVFEGFFYIALGSLFGMNWHKVKKLSTFTLVLLVVVGLCCSYFISSDAHLPFCAGASIGLFLLSVRRHGPELKPCIWARSASTIIYLIHMYFVVYYVYFIGGGTEAVLYSNHVDWTILFGFTLVCSVFVTAIVIPLSKKVPAIGRLFGI